MDKPSGNTASELDQIIPPEIKDDAFYRLISDLAATEDLRHVLEIGSSAGGGSTEAFVKGLARNPGAPKLFCIEVSKPRFEMLRATYADRPFVQCYNMSSVAPEEFPAPEVVEAFHRHEGTKLSQFPLEEVLRWLRQDIDYVRDAGVPAGAIEHIKAEHGIGTFDMVLIDGSEFTGDVELEKVYGARLILLDDTSTFKCHRARQRLLADPDYELIADDQELRNGYSAFRRRPQASDLPVHVLTIVLNGEPFIRYHEQVLSRLPFRWHWHVVEGVAELRHDTAWSTATGGRIPEGLHREGRSIDGTSEYLDDLARRFPGQVTIYRKPPGEFWDGKREMVNAPLPNITESCLLWQVDSDELWTVEQITAMRDRFLAEPTRSAAYYWCWYFVGPDRIASTRHGYANNPAQEWLRTWRFRPGDTWAKHEPPTLVRPAFDGGLPADIAALNPFTQDETEALGAVFQHFAYVTEAQLAFKESYYGYAGALEKWRGLQAVQGSGFLADHFDWVKDRTMFDAAGVFRIPPLARPDGAGGWTFADPAGAPAAPLPVAVRPRIVVDGVYWQDLNSGIGRVWQSMLTEWVKAGQSDHVVVLDRAGTAPRIAGVHYRTIAARDPGRTAEDSVYLERICRELGADLCVSTYYSTPLETPSFFFGYDMIPERTGVDLRAEAWQEKARAIRHAAGHAMISRSSARDLAALYPEVAEESVALAYCGLPDGFTPPSEAEIAEARRALSLPARYALMVGDRSGVDGYKNGILAFRGAEEAAARGTRIPIICVGGHEEIEAAFRAAAPHVDARRMKADDATLRLLYGGAHALLYPSRYEGFGMPVLEAMACGCPVITCANSSLPEVGGEAAIYVDDKDPAQMADALIALADPATRAKRIAAGLAQAGRFTTAAQAAAAMDAFRATAADLAAGRRAPPGSGWRELRTYQAGVQAWIAYGAAKDALARAGQGMAPPSGASPAMNAALQRALQEMESMKTSPFWRLRSLVIGALRLTGLRRRG
ncbi:glycosyltransferase family 4 protein [Neoroseomonas rubea]|uniref:glycosyltransferase family 4 protein n=1 Tax=Neoroseomonas rubea TaxID=2748666 RepID=UPI0018DF5D37|nr:glycosyltransferase family 1 protein [Roseomonas rubea]